MVAAGGLGEDDWHEATEMDDAGVTAAEYCPDWWPADTRLLIGRVALGSVQVSADHRSRRRRTLHRYKQDLPFPDLAQAARRLRGWPCRFGKRVRSRCRRLYRGLLPGGGLEFHYQLGGHPAAVFYLDALGFGPLADFSGVQAVR